MIFKQIITFFIAFNFIATPIIKAEADINETDCENAPFAEETYLPVGDERGRYVYTKKDVVKKCKIKVITTGKCLKSTEEEDTTGDLVVDNNFTTYRSSYYGSGLGETLAAIHTMEMIPKIWTGWHGYCEIGWKVDMSWATDPMYWVSLAASTLAESAGGDNVVANSDVGKAYKSGMDSYKDAIATMATKAGLKLTESTLQCVTSSSINFLAVGVSYYMDDKDVPCDPTDDFCDEETKQDDDEEKIFPIQQSAYDELPEEDKKYLTVVGSRFKSKGVDPKTNKAGDVWMVNVKRVSPTPEEMLSMDAKEIEKMRDELKKVQATIGVLMAAGEFGACMLTGGSIGSTGSVINKQQDTTRATMVAATKAGLGFLPAESLGPYGPLVKAALTVLVDLVGSFNNIDSCHNEEDASMQGGRHSATQKATKYNLCLTHSKRKVSDIFPDFKLYGYDKCCYDQTMTKVLVTQMKAQLGMDFKNCTGVTVDDIKKINWQQCDLSKMEKKIGQEWVPGKDGCKDGSLEKNLMDKDYNATQSCQYQQKCIDMSEYKNYLKQTLGSIDTSSVDEIFQDTSDLINEQGLQ